MNTVFRCSVAMVLFALGVPASAKAPPKPKLIVTLVVDQFAADLFQQYRPTYHTGMKRLSAGVTYINGYQSHAATETCPGHSTILTGRHPAATGIIANSWYQRAEGKFLYCVAVPGADSQARGPENLRVDTLGTWLKASEPGAQVVTVSGKDRAAIMLAGHHADAVYWWQDGEGFGTSRWAGPTGANVTSPARMFDDALLANWHKSTPKLWPSQIPSRCVELERPEQFGGVRLSGKIPADGHAATPGDKAFSAELHASPLFDRLALDFAGELIKTRHFGGGTATDLIAVSLSATDYIGHTYGKSGPEMCVQMAELDQALGSFLQRLDALKVPYVVVLTADHGSTDAAERAARKGLDAGRIDAGELIAQLNAYLAKALQLDEKPIDGSDPQNLVIRVGDDPTLYARIRDEAVGWLKTQRHIAQVLTRDEVMAAAPSVGISPDKLTVAERFSESFDPSRSGDIFVAFDPHYSALMPRKTGDAVAGHGSPWDYDRLVPILFWWPGAPMETVSRAIETVDIAPTLAAIAGIRTPLLDGQCLPEVTDCEKSGASTTPR